MLEKDLLFEIKPVYNILYTIIPHFWDVAVFAFVVIILRFTTRMDNTCNYYYYTCITNCCIGYFVKKGT